MKAHIRRQMIDMRKQLTPEEKQSFDQRIVASIRKDERYQNAKTIALFYPMMHEIDLRALLKDKKIFLFPKVIGNDIKFYTYHSDTRFVKSVFGVYEPEGDTPFLENIDYMLVPALAIDKQGYRIGYGKGFYDRYLMNNRPKTVIGVIYPFQYIENIDYSPFDQKLDDCVKG